MYGGGRHATAGIAQGRLLMAAAVVTVLAAALLMAVGQAEASAATNNTVMAWGDDSYGLLGNADGGEFSAVPLAVSALSGLTVTAVSAGGDHSVALLSDGKVMAWGSGVYGELGDGKVPGGAVQLNLPPDVTVTAVSAGGEYSLALLSNGTVMAWGQGDLHSHRHGAGQCYARIRPQALNLPWKLAPGRGATLTQASR
jgi:alpha-tubulin suppressor-like RCC1 family protein